MNTEKEEQTMNNTANLIDSLYSQMTGPTQQEQGEPVEFGVNLNHPAPSYGNAIVTEGTQPTTIGSALLCAVANIINGGSALPSPAEVAEAAGIDEKYILQAIEDSDALHLVTLYTDMTVTMTEKGLDLARINGWMTAESAETYWKIVAPCIPMTQAAENGWLDGEEQPDNKAPMEPLALTLLEAVVESVSFFWQPGVIITLEPVISRLCGTHGIDNIERGRTSDCVALVTEAAEAGLVVVDWRDGKRMIQYAASTLGLTAAGLELAVERGWLDGEEQPGDELLNPPQCSTCHAYAAESDLDGQCVGCAEEASPEPQPETFGQQSPSTWVKSTTGKLRLIVKQGNSSTLVIYEGRSGWRRGHIKSSTPCFSTADRVSDEDFAEHILPLLKDGEACTTTEKRHIKVTPIAKAPKESPDKAPKATVADADRDDRDGRISELEKYCARIANKQLDAMHARIAQDKRIEELEQQIEGLQTLLCGFANQMAGAAKIVRSALDESA